MPLGWRPLACLGPAPPSGPFTGFGGLVIASCWLSHLQYDWQSPVWRHFLESLGRIATTIRYDERGFGLRLEGPGATGGVGR